jgi:hypothetical protein
MREQKRERERERERERGRASSRYREIKRKEEQPVVGEARGSEVPVLKA